MDLKSNDLSGFTFKKVSSGAYRVTYTNKRGDYYTAIINDMTAIDNTLHAEVAKIKDISYLRLIVKLRGSHYNSKGERLPY